MKTSAAAAAACAPLIGAAPACGATRARADEIAARRRDPRQSPRAWRTGAAARLVVAGHAALHCASRPKSYPAIMRAPDLTPPIRRPFDAAARDQALGRYGLAECLLVPIAAVDERAISTYVGDVVGCTSGGPGRRALLVLADEPLPRDPAFPIFDQAGADILHQRLQFWVDVAYTRYRRAYRAAFPAEILGDRVLSHAMNRQVAASKGFRYVRLTPVSRGANSSSAFSEGWAKALHSLIATNRVRGGAVAYADLTELMLMLDMKLGGGVMNAVNEGQKLIRPRC